MSPESGRGDAAHRDTADASLPAPLRGPEHAPHISPEVSPDGLHRRRPPRHRLPNAMPSSAAPLVGVVMGSKSDFEHMQHCCAMLDELQVPYEARVVSAHRTPDWMFEYAASAESRGLLVIIAAAGGAAHLPGMIAAKSLVPVLGVPIPATLLNGQDALLSIVQMPAGVPVGTLAIGKPGAINAAILASEIVAVRHPEVRDRLRHWRDARRDDVLTQVLP